MDLQYRLTLNAVVSLIQLWLLYEETLIPKVDVAYGLLATAYFRKHINILKTDVWKYKVQCRPLLEHNGPP